ncbi:hypothetical protein [Methylomonas sp.]|uniref:hypothetical protein n=1 Tax=Methylomonas sp. TaxID=418 RepID=UPI0025E326FA|nr:hypothetical protein [Methylomonas sp.]
MPEQQDGRSITFHPPVLFQLRMDFVVIKSALSDKTGKGREVFLGRFLSEINQGLHPLLGFGNYYMAATAVPAMSV